MTQNTTDIKDLQERGVEDRVTIKSLYKRIVALEVKFDAMWDENKEVRKQFKRYVEWLMFWVVLDVVFSIIFIWIHLR